MTKANDPHLLGSAYPELGGDVLAGYAHRDEHRRAVAVGLDELGVYPRRQPPGAAAHSVERHRFNPCCVHVAGRGGGGADLDEGFVLSEQKTCRVYRHTIDDFPVTLEQMQRLWRVGGGVLLNLPTFTPTWREDSTM